MGLNHNKLLRFNQEAFEQLNLANTIIQLTKTSCEQREFCGQYYGVSDEARKRLSIERNNYINMLEILSDKISSIINLNESIEEEIALQ